MLKTQMPRCNSKTCSNGRPMQREIFSGLSPSRSWPQGSRGFGYCKLSKVIIYRLINRYVSLNCSLFVELVAHISKKDCFVIGCCS